jgi:hypothetical protein
LWARQVVESILNSKRCPTDINKSNEHSKMFGLDVVRRREKTHFENTAGFDITDGWMAPDLGCFVLDHRFKSLKNEAGMRFPGMAAGLLLPIRCLGTRNDDN